MNKFKIGDRVRRIGNSLGEHIVQGNVYTVKLVSASGDITVTETRGLWDSELFILVPSTTPRKHAELIKAWADGAVIEYRCMKKGISQGWYDWTDSTSPTWTTSDTIEYRLKPEPKPDHVVSWGCVPMEEIKRVRFTLDGETCKIKAVSLEDS